MPERGKEDKKPGGGGGCEKNLRGVIPETAVKKTKCGGSCEKN